MSLLKLLWALAANLPAILKMIQALVDYAKEQEKKQKLKEDLNAIEQAFKNKDPDALRKVFSS